MKILLVHHLPPHHWRVRVVQWYYRKQSVEIFSPDQIAFDGAIWKEIDLHSKQLAEKWYKRNDTDFTLHAAISYGSLLTLPLFLLVRDALCEAYSLARYQHIFQPDRTIVLTSSLHSTSGLYKTLMVSILKFIRLRLQKFTKQPTPSHNEQEFVFVLAKQELHSSVVKLFIPIIKTLVEMNKRVSLVTFDAKTLAALQTHFPNTHGYDLSRTCPAPFFRYISFLWKLFVNLTRKQHQPPISVDGVQINTRKLGLEKYVLEQLPHLFQYHHALAPILHTNMTILSAIETHPKERLVFIRAAQKNIQTILVQHGVTNETTKNILVNTPSVASKLFVWGEGARSYFIKHGTPAERLSVTGSTLFDAQKHKTETREEILSRNQLPEKRFILFSSQNFDASKNKALCVLTLKAFHDLLLSHNDVALIITLHPARSLHTRESDVETLIQNRSLVLNETVFIQKTVTEIQNLQQISEFLITSSSTLHIEALLKERPVIMINMDDVEPMDIVKEHAAPEAHTETELLQAMKTLLTQDGKLLYDKEREKFLQQAINFPHSAAEMIVRSLLQ